MMQNTERNQRDMRIQDAFLNYCRRQKAIVTIQFIEKSSKIGQIVGFDNQSIILDDNGSQHLIYKQAVLAIHPQNPVNCIFNDAYRGEGYRHQDLKAYPEYAADFA